jgi:hypothetical protein
MQVKGTPNLASKSQEQFKKRCPLNHTFQKLGKESDISVYT